MYLFTASARRSESFWLYCAEPSLSVWPLTLMNRITANSLVRAITSLSSLACASFDSVELLNPNSSVEVIESTLGFAAGFAAGLGAGGGGGGGGSLRGGVWR